MISRRGRCATSPSRAALNACRPGTSSTCAASGSSHLQRERRALPGRLQRHNQGVATRVSDRVAPPPTASRRDSPPRATSVSACATRSSPDARRHRSPRPPVHRRPAPFRSRSTALHLDQRRRRGEGGHAAEPAAGGIELARPLAVEDEEAAAGPEEEVAPLDAVDGVRPHRGHRGYWEAKRRRRCRR